MNKQKNLFSKALVLWCLLAVIEASAAKKPPPTPVNTIPTNLQAELNGGVKLLGGIAISGNTLASTCGYTTVAGVAENAMCMYQRSGTTWTVQPKVSPVASPSLMGAPALSANTLVVPITVTGNSANFAHYVFERNASLAWNQQAILAPNAGDSFTEISAISGNTVVLLCQIHSRAT